MADMFQILILICSAQLSAQDCNRDNAIDVINGQSTRNEMTCIHDAEESLARTAFTGSGVYPKIMCGRIRTAQEQPSTAQD
jgi:hypothetical protein